MINCDDFIKNMYPHPKFTRHRKNYEVITAFKDAVEKIMNGFCLHFNNFQDSLRYKRLFYLRREYRQLISDKMNYADMR